jgi:ADP-ribose pyrophosphatase
MTTLSSTTIFTGRVFSVTRDLVRLPHGTDATLEIVRHRGSVVLLPVPHDDSLMLVRQYRHALGRAVWEVPAGSLEEGEDPVEGARRECHEEVGRWPGRVELLASLYPSPGYTDEVMHFYRLTDLSIPDQPAVLDPDEDLEVRTVSLDELGTMIAKGEVVDMKTVVAKQLLTDTRR